MGTVTGTIAITRPLCRLIAVNNRGYQSVTIAVNNRGYLPVSGVTNRLQSRLPKNRLPKNRLPKTGLPGRSIWKNRLPIGYRVPGTGYRVPGTGYHLVGLETICNRVFHCVLDFT